MRAAILHGPEDLRVEDVPDPEPGDGEVLVHVEAATTCGTDVKMWRRGHPILPPYPARFGHETAGIRDDTGERVLVGDSLACGECRQCRSQRPQICRAPRWILGGHAEAIGAMTATSLADHDVVFEAVGRPDAWRAAVRACAPGGAVVFVGGCAPGSDARLPTRPLHYDELDLRGAFHHSPAEVDRALALLADGSVDWRTLAAGPIGLDELPG